MNETKQNNRIETFPKEYFFAGIFLAVILFIGFAEELRKGVNLYVLYAYDATPHYYFYPAEVFLKNQISKGLMPLWDNLRGLGEPTIGPIIITAFHPFRLPIYLLPFNIGLSVFVLLRLWTAGFGMYFAGRHFKLGRPGSMTAALSYMLCGYFMEYVSFQDMNIYPLFPIILGFFKKSFDKQSIVDLLLFVFCVSLIGAGGHPEAIFFGLGLTFYSSWMIILTSRKTGREKIKWMALCLMIVSWPFGSHFLEIGGFTEFLFFGWQYHAPGFGRLHFDVRMLPSLFHPFFNAGLESFIKTVNSGTIIQAAPNCWGLIPSILFFTAMARLKRAPREISQLAIILIPMLGLIFRIPPFEYLSMLPILDISYNHRYLQPIIAFPAAIFAGAGVKLIFDSHNKKEIKIAAGLTAFLTAAAIVAGAFGSKFIPLPGCGKEFAYLSIMTLIFSLSIISILFLIHKKILSQRYIAAILIVVLSVNLLMSKKFAGPALITRMTLPSDLDRNKFASWPQATRIYGVGRDLLHPNIAEIYGLNDLRDQSAMIPANYANMVIKLNGLSTPKEILDHFIGSGWYLEIDYSKLTPDWQDVFGIEKIFTWSEPDAIDLWPDFIKNSDYYFPTPREVNYIPVKIKNTTRNSMVFNAPGMIDGKLKIPDTAAQLAISTAKSNLTDPACYMMSVDSGSGKKVKYSRCFSDWEIEWKNARLDAANYAGREISLKLWNAPMRTKPHKPVLAAWGNGYLTTTRGNAGYELVDERDFRVYANLDALPNAFVLDAQPPKDFSADAGAIKKSVKKESSRILENEGSFLSISVNPADGDWLMISRVYLPGWKCFATDSKGVKVERKVGRCLDGFSCAPLESRDRKIEYEFHPVLFKIGFWALFVHYVFTIVVVCAHILSRIISGKLTPR